MPDYKKMIWSFSRVNSYATCPKMFKLSYLQREIQKENNAFAEWGSFCHSILENYAKGNIDVYELKDHYEEKYEDNVTIQFPPSKYVDLNDSYYNNGKDYFTNFEGFPDNWKIIAVEKEISINIEGYHFTGYIDLVVQDTTDGRYIVVDHKSKSKFKDDAERNHYAIQLYMYATWIYETFHEYPKELIFNMFRARDMVRIPFNEEDYHKSRKWLVDTIHSIEKDTSFKDKILIDYKKKKKPLKQYRNNDFFCCNLCSVRNYCRRSGRKESKE